MLAKVTKFRRCTLITSKVIGKKPRAWSKTPAPSSLYRVKKMEARAKEAEVVVLEREH